MFGIVKGPRMRKRTRMPKRPIDLSKWDLTSVPDAVIIAEAGRRRQKLGHKPKTPTPCKHCGKIFGAAEVRKHWPVCPKKPIRGTAKKKDLRS